jgi:hypothetical protein
MKLDLYLRQFDCCRSRCSLLHESELEIELRATVQAVPSTSKKSIISEVEGPLSIRHIFRLVQPSWIILLHSAHKLCCQNPVVLNEFDQLDDLSFLLLHLENPNATEFEKMCDENFVPPHETTEILLEVIGNIHIPDRFHKGSSTICLQKMIQGFLVIAASD